jgi:transposase
MGQLFVGVDISKDRLDVHVRPGGEAFAVTRDGKGLEALVERLRTLSPTLVAMEATGGFETIVAAAIAGRAAAAGGGEPGPDPPLCPSGRQASKNRSDRCQHHRSLCRRWSRPAPRSLPDEAARLFAELVGRRRQIIEIMVAEGQREKRAVNARVRKSLARHIAMLEKELSAINQDIDTLVRGSPVWRAKEDLLASVPGIGKILARTLLAELPELGDLARMSGLPDMRYRREIASLALQVLPGLLPTRVSPGAGVAKA